MPEWEVGDRIEDLEDDSVTRFGIVSVIDGDDVRVTWDTCKFPLSINDGREYRKIEDPATLFPGIKADWSVPCPDSKEGCLVQHTGETRVVDEETGGEKGRKPGELGFIDPLALEELGLVASFGRMKYDSFNYLRGYRFSLTFNAALRHLMKFLKGEDRDFSTCKAHSEWKNEDWSCTDCGSGLLHTTHLAWHGLAMTSFVLRGIGKDDRAPR